MSQLLSRGTIFLRRGNAAPYLVALGSFGHELLHQSDEALLVRLGELDLDRLFSFLSHGLLLAALG